MNDAWALWPDGTLCHWDEIDEMTHMSDDYELLDDDQLIERDPETAALVGLIPAFNFGPEDV